MKLNIPTRAKLKYIKFHKYLLCKGLPCYFFCDCRDWAPARRTRINSLTNIENIYFKTNKELLNFLNEIKEENPHFSFYLTEEKIRIGFRPSQYILEYKII